MSRVLLVLVLVAYIECDAADGDDADGDDAADGGDDADDSQGSRNTMPWPDFSASCFGTDSDSEIWRCNSQICSRNAQCSCCGNGEQQQEPPPGIGDVQQQHRVHTMLQEEMCCQQLEGGSGAPGAGLPYVPEGADAADDADDEEEEEEEEEKEEEEEEEEEPHSVSTAFATSSFGRTADATWRCRSRLSSEGEQ